MWRGAKYLGFALPLLVAVSACGTDTTAPPSVASVDVTPSADDLFVAETVQLTATPKSATGTTLTGRTVTWSTSDGSVASVSATGLVTAEGPGQTNVMATSEGQSGSASITVSLRPVAVVEIDPTGPVEIFESQTAQLTATTKDDQDNVLAGRTVTWESNAEGVATVDGTGLVTGVAEGSAEVTATSEGISESVTVNVTDPGPVTIVQVTPGPLVEGQAATITGTGFVPTPGLNTVLVGGVAATVLQATTTDLEITVPSSVCRPKRGANVVVTVGSDTSLPAAVTVSPASFLSMAVGDQVTLTDPSDLCLQFDEAAGAERYLVGVQAVSEVAGSLTGVRVAGEAGSGGGGPLLPPPPLGPRSAPMSAGTVDVARAESRARQRDAELAFMERSRELLESVRRARPVSPTPAYRTGPARIPADVVVGSELPLRFPDFTGNSCTGFTEITVVVRKVSTHSILVEDKDNPANGFVAQDFDDITADFDGSIYATDVAYFGTPTDMDTNQRIVIVVTKEVNELDGPQGFVSGADLFPVSSCAASNEGEYYYQEAPDPTGLHGGVQTLADSRLEARSLMAHEFAHIIQLGGRMTAGGPFMTSFMAEGGATAAEQYAGFAFEGLADGQNYTTSVIYPPGADPHFYFGFMGDMVSYFGSDFANGRIENAPEQCTWVGTPSGEQGPCAGGRLVYGITFSLLQHGIDVYGPGLGGAQAVHQAFVDHTGAAGFAALEAVFGVSVADLMATWAPMLYIDDRFMDPSLADYQFLNWNLRSMEAAWGSEATLLPRARVFGDFTDDVSVRSASTAFFDVSGAGRSASALRVTDQAGESLPSTFQVFIVRVE